MGPGGTLLPFTALVAPFPAEIENPRAQQAISISATLENATGLWLPDGTSQKSFAGLPVYGVADLWGKGAGYKTVWDVIEETRQKGVCRRIPQVPEVELPCPILMMHMDAVVSRTYRAPHDLKVWLHGHGVEWSMTGGEDEPPGYQLGTVSGQPWHSEAESLGRVGDDDFMWHPYVKLYKKIAGLKEEKLFSEFCRQFGMEQGVFGLSWITKFAYVLGEGETEVPDHLKAKGVEAAVGEDDPRAKFLEELDDAAWDELEAW
jgi:hypothetical protein